MSTQYHIEFEPCSHCGLSKKAIIIGHSSYGWKFSFEQNKEFNLNSHKEWVEFLKDKQISDEYERHHALSDFLAMVDSKQNGIWGATCPLKEYGSSNPLEYEYLDEEGYRFWKDRS